MPYKQNHLSTRVIPLRPGGHSGVLWGAQGCYGVVWGAAGCVTSVTLRVESPTRGGFLRGALMAVKAR